MYLDGGKVEYYQEESSSLLGFRVVRQTPLKIGHLNTKLVKMRATHV